MCGLWSDPTVLQLTVFSTLLPPKTRPPILRIADQVNYIFSDDVLLCKIFKAYGISINE